MEAKESIKALTIEKAKAEFFRAELD